ncbi:MAG: hypothetical protein KJO07_20765, partial [Deltaproteobacteria bacterium]|nr:hypothetical protein [Deltaproteobacteria bacterium]
MKRLDEITASELRTETRIRGSIETARVACLLGMASLMLGGAAAPAVAQVPTTPPTFYKVFSPDAIGPGSTTRLIFTIDNTNATNAITTSPLSDLAFTDVLPSEITIATPASATTDCAGALLTAPEGGGTITMTDGRLGADSLCTVEVNVTSDVIGEGPYTNVSGDLTSSAGNHGDAEADLTVDGDRPGFSKAFSPSSIPLLGTSTLTFTIDNPVAGSLLGIFAFSDVLPPGMTLADPSNATTTCSGSGFSLGEPESRTIFFTGGSLSAGSSCTASIDVTTDTGGTFENVSSELEFGSSSTDTSSGFATAALEVPIEFLNKAFVNDPVPPGGQVDLRFTIVNPSRTDAATGIAFDDDLTFLTDLTAVGLPLTEACDPDGPGGSPGTGTLSGTTFLSFSGGSLPPEGSCTFSVPLSVDPDSNPDTYINTTSAVTATIGGDAVTGNVATDELTVSFVPTFTKEFLDNPVGAGGTTTLRFTITNTSPGDSLDDIAFTDVFDEVLPTASVVPSNPVCNGGTAVFTPLISSGSTNNPARFAVIGASLDPSESCTIELTLDVVAGAADGTYPNATSTITGLLGGEEPVEGLPASDDLVIV